MLYNLPEFDQEMRTSFNNFDAIVSRVLAAPRGENRPQTEADADALPKKMRSKLNRLIDDLRRSLEQGERRNQFVVEHELEPGTFQDNAKNQLVANQWRLPLLNPTIL